ncbi:MAG: glycosyltransferase [Acidimicrobiales bacterium]
MKLAVAASEIPDPQGTAAGRDLWAWCEGARALGHEVDAWIWRPPDPPSSAPVPSWARYEPVDFGPHWRAHLRGLLLPRNDAALGSWHPDPDAVVVADHVWSIGAVLGRPRSVTTLHFRVLADARAMRHLTAANLQTARAERRAARRSGLVLAYSDRVAAHLPRRARVVPIAHPVPERPIEVVEEPVASMLANWRWPPNRAALAVLLAMWPRVRAAVPGARLLLGGRYFPTDEVGTVPGVEVMGEVRSSVEVLERSAVVAFPCPPSSGPKAKVLEALLHGVPVVTTPPGMEGIMADGGLDAMVATEARFESRLIELLADAGERARVVAAVRPDVTAHHSPEGSARARLAAFAETFGATTPL